VSELTAPPREIPPELIDAYTIGGRIPVRKNYFDGTYSEPVVYSREKIDTVLAQVAAGKTFYYGKTDLWLRNALQRFPIRGQEVAVMGSVEPIYESTVIHHGGQPITIEYNKIASEDARLKTLTVAEFERSPRQFDVAFSISSFEHDGLGRYGDPLNPDGDLAAMARMKNVVKPNGLLFLAVPVGCDALVWNAHRVYGPIRLPLLLSDWEVLAAFPGQQFFPRAKDGDQPVFVLRNAAGDATCIDGLLKQLRRRTKVRALVNNLFGRGRS
jgi:hypothetical protein